MINVGVIGLGMMGLTHLDAYAKRSDVKVVAVADKDPARLSGQVKAAGNVEGQAQGAFDLSQAAKYEDGMALIKDKNVQAVDICLATPLHLEFALAAMKKGKHVLIEKPLARTSKDADKIAKAAARAKGVVMCAMCMRFWPGWTWLKDAVKAGTYGRVLSANFRRTASMPPGGFYANAELSGAAILDLHIHDTDFIQFVFGSPAAVMSAGYSKTTTGVDHIVTQYLFEADAGVKAPMVFAEGTWAMSAGYPFNMQYTVNFENATAVFDLGAADHLVLCREGQKQAIELDKTMGYDLELGYFLECIAAGKKPEIVTMDDAANAVRIIEAEAKSVATGKSVKIARKATAKV